MIRRLLIIAMMLLLVGCVSRSSRAPYIEENVYKSEQTPRIEVAVNSDIEYQGKIENNDFKMHRNSSSKGTNVKREISYFVNEDPLQAVFIYTQKITGNNSYFLPITKKEVQPTYFYEKIKIDGFSYQVFTAPHGPFNKEDASVLEKKVPIFKKFNKPIFKIFLRRVGANNNIRLWIIYAEEKPSTLNDFKYMTEAHTEFLKEFDQRAASHMIISKHIPKY